MIWLARSSNKILSHTILSTPNPQCSICKVVYVPLSIRRDFTLGEFVDSIVVKELGYEGQVTVQEGARILFETEDFEENRGKLLSELDAGEGKSVNVLDDDEPRVPVAFSITLVPSFSPLPLLRVRSALNLRRCYRYLPAESTESYIIATPIPSIPMKVPLPPPHPESDDDSDAIEVEGVKLISGSGKKRSADQAGLESAGNEVKKAKDESVLLIE